MKAVDVIRSYLKQTVSFQVEVGLYDVLKTWRQILHLSNHCILDVVDQNI